MEPTNKDIEELFIQETLDQHGEYLLDLFTDTIERKKLIKEGDLISGISFKTEKRGGMWVLSFSFKGYGRLIEINYFRHRKNKANSLRSNFDVFSAGTKERKQRRKDTRWYTRNVYGSQNKLIGLLGSGLSNTEMARLKGILSKNIEDGTYVKWKSPYFASGATTYANI